MKVEFSATQFRALLELVYLGGWMANAIRPPDQQVRSFVELERSVFSVAGQFGLSDAVEFEKRLGEFIATSEFEERMDEYVAEYDNEVFWDELVDRLADRDLLEEYGDAFAAMTVEQQIAKREPIVERYEREAEQHGLGRLRIVGL